MSHRSHPPYRIGLRTIKTGLAVIIALLLDTLRPSAIPIFAAIGAIVVMSRTLSDAITAATTQLAGITCGALAGCLFTLLFPNDRYVAIGLGLILLIPICHPLRIGFAVPLTCIVFVSVCLYDPTHGTPVAYAMNRFLDTSIGLAVGFSVNFVIKPYNNHSLILRLFHEYLESYPSALSELLMHGHYPVLSPFETKIRHLHDEIRLFSEQPFPHRKQRKEEAAYLEGCYQLAEKMYLALSALCGMDTLGIPCQRSCQRLSALGITLSTAEAPRPPLDKNNDENNTVLNYHLNTLLDARSFLTELLNNAAPKQI